VGAGGGGFNSVRALKFIWKIAPSIELLLSPMHKSKKKNAKAHAKAQKIKYLAILVQGPRASTLGVGMVLNLA
jgi:hypothetical protein